MKFRYVLLTSLLLTLFAEYVAATLIEGAAVLNVTMLYLAVAFLPTLVVIIANGLWLELLKRFRNRIWAASLSALPLILLALLCFSGWHLMDLGVGFVGISGLVGVGTTNLFWVIKLFEPQKEQIQ